MEGEGDEIKSKQASKRDRTITTRVFYFKITTKNYEIRYEYGKSTLSIQFRKEKP